MTKKNIFKAVFFLLLIPSHNIYAATLTVNPEEEYIRVGQKISLNFDLSVEKPINAIESWISFPPRILKVEKVVSEDSIMSLWAVLPEIDNSSGLVHFVAGLPDPGYTKKEGGRMISLIFKAISPGIADVSYVETSKAVLADGLGTPDKLIIRSALISVSPIQPMGRPLTLAFFIIIVFIIIYKIKNHHARSF